MVCFVRAYHFFLGSYRLYGLHAALYYGYFIRLDVRTIFSFLRPGSAR